MHPRKKREAEGPQSRSARKVAMGHTQGNPSPNMAQGDLRQSGNSACAVACAAQDAMDPNPTVHLHGGRLGGNAGSLDTGDNGLHLC